MKNIYLQKLGLKQFLRLTLSSNQGTMYFAGGGKLPVEQKRIAMFSYNSL